MFIWCGTGLLDSRVVQTTFVFGGRKGICASSYVHSGWRVSRNESEPYTCGLHIENIQPSDSGEYYCEVNLPGTLDTVRSTIVHVEVASTNPNPNPNPNVLILETVIPSVGGLLILVIPALIITVACIVIRRHRQGRHHDDPHRQVLYNEDDQHNFLLPRNPPGKIISFNYMKYCASYSWIKQTVFFGGGSFQLWQQGPDHIHVILIPKMATGMATNSPLMPVVARFMIHHIWAVT